MSRDRTRTAMLPGIIGPVIALLALASGVTADDPQSPADLVLTGGRVITVDDAVPHAEAIACRGDRILAVGSAEAIAPLIGPQTEVLTLQGAQTVIPGFIEAHGHFVSLGRAQQTLDLSPARGWEEIVALVAAAAAEAVPGEWIIGRGWHQSKWEHPPQPGVEGYPVHAALSRVTPRNPVRLDHASHHLCLVNALALELSGITGKTPDPEGGEILRDQSGHPTGVLRENAQSLVTTETLTPTAHAESLRRAIRLATHECLRHGITSFQDAGSSFREIDLFRELAEDGKLGVRLWVMIRESNARLRRSLDEYRMIGVGDHRLSVRAIKRSLDGALGAHGAWLLEPYADLPQGTGLQTLSLAALGETAELARSHGFQLCVHAIGDRANREVLDLFEQTFADMPPAESLRWRIEHAQHLHPRDVPRFGELGVIASMQGIHCTSDAAFVIERLGERRAREGAYLWRSLLDTGAVVINGTDAPVEAVDPIASYHASVTRRPAGGRAFFPEQCMTRQQALRSYTLDAAWAAFEEDDKGSLTPGKLADLVVLSNDLLECPDEEILSTQVVHTIVGGRLVYSRDATAIAPDNATPD